ncbi:alpha/beta hydrolase [Massilia sp. Se16.2.3]|uniref:alpha/beta hydrolase n=1 Tax=Massilia sp. Se16.2.3 TaxID=2709303 RepID=UPI0016044D0D|nr:phospholipase [Massilia sp. Se16.2.3]QNA97943.1 phospholipase [Massilia sp. Se16.2.3]
MNELGHLQVGLPDPGARLPADAPTGLQKLDIGSRRDSYLYVPGDYTAQQPLPLVLLLHGAGGHAHDGLHILLHLADQVCLILLAPASHASTRDIIARRGYGQDLALVDRALAFAFAHYAVDSERLGIGGFSDGASYALTLGLANGELFTHVLAFSPGFIGPMAQRGAPEVFISHGDADRVLPIDHCGRTIARRLDAAGYGLVYQEFHGGHFIPSDIASQSVDWFLGTNQPSGAQLG